jgi:hypothetical protein
MRFSRVSVLIYLYQEFDYEDKTELIEAQPGAKLKAIAALN